MTAREKILKTLEEYGYAPHSALEDNQYCANRGGERWCKISYSTTCKDCHFATCGINGEREALAKIITEHEYTEKRLEEMVNKLRQRTKSLESKINTLNRADDYVDFIFQEVCE